MEHNYKDISVFRDLIEACDAEVSLHQSEIHFSFPISEEMKAEIDRMNDVTHNCLVLGARPLHTMLRGLAKNPQFRRCTSFAHHATFFSQQLPGYGKMKCRKKANKPFQIICESDEFAQKLFNDLTGEAK